jgi:3-deoxy-7-phosphoheptulonate synthase
MPAGDRAGTVARHRDAVRAVLDGRDDRMLVVAGPCSVHDPAAALDYARLLAGLGGLLRADLLVVMRAYFEKPRTRHGWQGLISDPGLDGTMDAARGLRAARALLRALAAEGVPAACEFLDPLAAPYLQDLVTCGFIGARTAESPGHRKMASGLPMPAGFKNAPDGDVMAAIDACHVAASGQEMIAASPDGTGHAIAATGGNPDCVVVLRGGRAGPNYRPADVTAVLGLIAGAGLPRRVLVDASHGNSGKDHARQPAVAMDVAAQVAAGEHGIRGLMLESFLQEGRQDPDLAAGPESLAYGQSITDACIGIEDTAGILDALARAARDRRKAAAG